MDKKTEQRVNGLANIGALLSRNPDALKPAPRVPTDGKRTRDAICQRTIGNLQGLTVDKHQGVMRRIVEASVREAYNLGHADALDQNEIAEGLLEKQYKARTELTLPAAVAGIMEQLGMTELHIELDALSTVFKRNRLDINTHVVDEIERANTQVAEDSFIVYTLHPLADDGGAPDNTYALEG